MFKVLENLPINLYATSSLLVITVDKLCKQLGLILIQTNCHSDAIPVKLIFNPLYTGNHKQVFLQTVKTQMNASLFVKVKRSSDKKYNIFAKITRTRSELSSHTPRR